MVLDLFFMIILISLLLLRVVWRLRLCLCLPSGYTSIGPSWLMLDIPSTGKWRWIIRC